MVQADDVDRAGEQQLRKEQTSYTFTRFLFYKKRKMGLRAKSLQNLKKSSLFSVSQ